MPWGVYKQKKKPYVVGGFSVVSKPKKPKKYSVGGFTQVSGSKGVGKLSGGVGAPSVVNRLLGNSAAAGGVGADTSQYDPYPSYNDPFSGMLANLARQEALAEGQLKGNLVGREAAIKKLYADQVPLVDANYNQAIKESAAVNDAVANQLHSQGDATNADLLSRLAGINAPQGATDQAAQQVKDYYGGLSNANYAMDAGDVQRLIGALSEAQNYLAKQPGVIAQQLESEYAQAIAQLKSDYMSQSTDLQGQQASGLNDYNLQKFGYEQDQKSKQADAKAKIAQDAEDRYWDNYWKQRDYQQKRYELAVATNNKKMQLAAQAEMKRLDRQKDVDLAKIRSNTQIATNANTVNQSNINNQRTTQTSAANNAANNAAKGKKVVTGATVVKAKQASLNAVFNGTFVRDGIVNDGNVQAKVNNQLRAYGIDPYSTQGTAIRKWVFSQLNGKKNRQGRVWKSGKDRLPK